MAQRKPGGRTATNTGVEVITRDDIAGLEDHAKRSLWEWLDGHDVPHNAVVERIVRLDEWRVFVYFTAGSRSPDGRRSELVAGFRKCEGWPF
jgi:hypothetical protein